MNFIEIITWTGVLIFRLGIIITGVMITVLMTQLYIKKMSKKIAIMEENVMLMHEDLAICHQCEKIKPREDMKYMRYVFRPNCFWVCSQCKNDCLHKRFMSYLIKEVE